MNSLLTMNDHDTWWKHIDDHDRHFFRCLDATNENTRRTVDDQRRKGFPAQKAVISAITSRLAADDRAFTSHSPDAADGSITAVCIDDKAIRSFTDSGRDCACVIVIPVDSTGVAIEQWWLEIQPDGTVEGVDGMIDSLIGILDSGDANGC